MEQMTEPRVDDYCTFCGCSPDSGCHLFGHKYRDPRELPPEKRKKVNPKCPICGVHICASVHDDCRKWFTGAR